MVIAILIVLGICLGSFINAFVWRHYRQMELRGQLDAIKGKKGKAKDTQNIEKQVESLSVMRGRSMCVHCGHILAPKDLVPVASYLWLRGRCRYCGKRIEDTPLAEVLTPVLFVISYVFWPYALHGMGLFVFVMWLIFLVGFVALTLYDLRWFLLPHSIVLPLIGLAALQVLIVATIFHGGLPYVAGALWGAFIIGGLFYGLYRVSREQWIGGGDITLGILLGLLVSGPAEALLLIFLASLFGTLVALPLLAMKKAQRTSHLPFGPFLMLAGLVVVLWGDQLLNWYTNFYGL